MPTDKAPSWLRRGSALPSRKNRSRVAAAGAISRPSRVINRSSARRNVMKHPPPRPELWPSTTPRVRAQAMAASTALPPSRKACKPASVATGFTVATRPLRGPAGSPALSPWLPRNGSSASSNKGRTIQGLNRPHRTWLENWSFIVMSPSASPSTPPWADVFAQAPPMSPTDAPLVQRCSTPGCLKSSKPLGGIRSRNLPRIKLAD